MLTRKAFLHILALSAFVSACMGTDPGAAIAARLGEREGAHHTAAVASTDGDTLRRETFAYGGDMHGMMDDMTARCGGMSNASIANMRRLARDMGIAIDDHLTTIERLTDVAAMRAECEEHHRTMAPMLQRVRDMMPGGGMMW